MLGPKCPVEQPTVLHLNQLTQVPQFIQLIQLIQLIQFSFSRLVFPFVSREPEQTKNEQGLLT